MVTETATPERAAELRRIVGDVSAVARDLRKVKKAAKVFSSDHPRLIEEYAQQWVAVFENKTLAADSLESLMEQLSEAQIPVEHAVVRFIDRTQRVLIL